MACYSPFGFRRAQCVGYYQFQAGLSQHGSQHCRFFFSEIHPKKTIESIQGYRSSRSHVSSPGVFAMLLYIALYLFSEWRWLDSSFVPIAYTFALIVITGFFSLVTGVSILRMDDNLSLAFLVMSNIYPATAPLFSFIRNPSGVCVTIWLYA